MRDIFILVPSFSPTGPVKGAVALANAAAHSRRVSLVAVKPGPGVDAEIDPRVRQVSLVEHGSMPRRVAAYRRMLRSAGGRSQTASISGCFSADMVNLACREVAVTCASVRGNLLANYRLDYRPVGVPLAIAHLCALRLADHVVTMNAAMSSQVSRFIGRRAAVIGNFVDESALEPYRNTNRRDGPLRFVFLGSLTPLKRPGVVVDAIRAVIDAGVCARLDVIGAGPLQDGLASRSRELGLESSVTLHGHLRDPLRLLAAADAMVLPSISEGTPRAGLEALHLGVPCVLRDTGGNSELISPGLNGALFTDESDLPDAMIRAGRLGRARAHRDTLLPMQCRQDRAASQYLALVEGA